MRRMAMERDVPTISMAPEDSDLSRLFDPGAAFRSSTGRAGRRTLDVGEKRAILSSWASDACAVAGRSRNGGPCRVGA